MSMKRFNLYLDDVRSMPHGFHIQAYNYDECIYWLKKVPIDTLSLDHDLGDLYQPQADLEGCLGIGVMGFHSESYVEGRPCKWCGFTQDLIQTAEFSDRKEKTGYDVMCWIEEQLKKQSDMNIFAQWVFELPSRILVHSSNPVDRKRMQQVIDKLYRK